jgi:hypothetical protein
VDWRRDVVPWKPNRVARRGYSAFCASSRPRAPAHAFRMLEYTYRILPFTSRGFAIAPRIAPHASRTVALQSGAATLSPPRCPIASVTRTILRVGVLL